MENKGSQPGFKITVLALFILSWLAVPIVRFSSCETEGYSFVDRDEFIEPNKGESSEQSSNASSEDRRSRGTPRQGVFFPGSIRKTERVVLYSNLYQCLYLERWRHPAHGRWSRDQRGGLARLWIEFGDNIQRVDEVDCIRDRLAG